MRNQVWYVATLIGLMCTVRFGLAMYGYLEPHALMEQLGAPFITSPQMPYIVRVWAIRDIVLALLVVLATPSTMASIGIRLEGEREIKNLPKNNVSDKNDN